MVISTCGGLQIILDCSLYSSLYMKKMFARIMGARNRRDRVRTVWTSEMDRYFLDLMLDQVRKGNRIDDHLFSKNAWTDMDAMFTAKFKVQNENDVLKNRHKTLRNLYRAVKNLLDQKGFCWDEARQMVTAENSVWNEYIKVHPEARSFRIKTIPYYTDLCLIFADASNGRNVSSFDNDMGLLGSLEIEHLEDPKSLPTSIDNLGGEEMATSVSDGKAMVALHDIMIDEDYGHSNSEKIVDDGAAQATADTPCTVIGHRTRTYWQPPMDRYFIELMLDQAQKGNQVDGLFCKEAWMEMMALFNAKFGFAYDVEILKNRYKTMRRQYNAIQNLLKLDGFFWDETRQMVVADDFVWQDYIKVHTDARQYMTRPIPYYKDLMVICRDLSLDGLECFSNQDLENGEIQEFQLGNSQSLGASTSNNEDEDHHRSMRDYMEDLDNLLCVHQKSNKHQLEDDPLSPGQPASKALKNDESLVSVVREMANVVSSLASERRGEWSSLAMVEDVVEAVQALPDMDEELVLDACDLLEEEKKAKTFLALDVKLRKKWLMRKLRPGYC